MIFPFKLVEDWKAILAKAWSVRMNILAAFLGALELTVSLVKPAGIPDGIFAAIAILVSLSANGARVLAQRELAPLELVPKEPASETPAK